ncbi:MAG TPA: 5-dehydro-4-deoxy-D-glucuronate isomerase [Candidatus Kryptonia bacterium]
MELRYSPGNVAYRTMTTSELRSAFLADNLFTAGKINMIYFDMDRAIVGGALPTKKSLSIESSKKEMAADYFTERREIGIFNVGGSGKIKTDGNILSVRHKDAAYIGKGTKEIVLSSDSGSNPAIFYFVSYPAHAAYPTTLMKFGEVYSAKLGTANEANVRTLNRYIHTKGVKSSQLVMGLTELEPGSVWNTMPPHTHQRRTEIYFYFNLKENSAVFHMMGEPSETRHIVVRNNQAVVSPSWSIHTGVATQNYSFIWAMGGENQEFEDMDGVDMASMK